MKINRLKFLAIALILVLNACSDSDDSVTDKESSSGEFFIGTMVVNTETYAGRVYIQLIDDMNPKSLSNDNAIPIPMGYPQFNGNDVYVFPSYAGESVNELQKFTRENTGLVKTGSLSLEEQSSATNIIFQNDDKAYLSMAGLGEIWSFNPQTMEKTGEIDLTGLGVGDTNPNPAVMVLRNGLLYVALSQMVGGYVAASDRPYSDIAIIDTETDKLLKMITEKSSNMSMPTRPVVEESMFIDENNDIYITCIGAFGQIPSHKSGFLRIKSGETDFDDSYIWDVTNADIEGEPNKISYIEAIIYAGNGKAYAYVHISAYEKEGENMYTAFAMEAVEIDIYAKTIKKLDLPMANSFSAGVNEYKDLIVFPNFNKTTSAFYTYNPETGEVKGPIIETSGYPIFFHYFGD